jgi:hypothetical protein
MAVSPSHTAPGTLKISELLANLDVDGDGDIDEEDMQLAKTIRAMDVDGDGTITLRELVAIGQSKLADGAHCASQLARCLGLRAHQLTRSVARGALVQRRRSRTCGGWWASWWSRRCSSVV